MIEGYIDQYFHVVLFIMQYKVFLTFKSVDKTPLCEYSNVSYRAVLSSGTVHSDVHGGLTFKLSFFNKTSVCDHILLVILTTTF